MTCGASAAAAASEHPAHPMYPMTAAQMGAALGGLSEQAVLERERAGALFSVRWPGRATTREYPAFQAWSGVAGVALTRVLQTLAPLSATDRYGFFAASTDLLGGLTPIEALTGTCTWDRLLDVEAQLLLAAATHERLRAVLGAAQALVALRAV